MDSVLALAKAEIAHDPNLADTGDVDMESSDEDFYDEDDGGEYDDGEYNDDEDTSWKVRRAACLLVVALVAAYPEHSAALYSECRPTLQARFKEREESVKLDVFVAFSALVRQRGATASEEERKGLAVDATDVTSALVKQLRATRSAKLKVRDIDSLKHGNRLLLHEASQQHSINQEVEVTCMREPSLRCIAHQSCSQYCGVAGGALSMREVVCRRVCLRCCKRSWRLQQMEASTEVRP